MKVFIELTEAEKPEGVPIRLPNSFLRLETSENSLKIVNFFSVVKNLVVPNNPKADLSNSQKFQEHERFPSRLFGTVLFSIFKTNSIIVLFVILRQRLAVSEHERPLFCTFSAIYNCEIFPKSTAHISKKRLPKTCKKGAFRARKPLTSGAK